MNKHYTKAQALSIFKETHKDSLKKYKNDIPAKREMWHNFTDMLCKDGEISDNQYHNWSNPY
jgi:hypothetical protein